MQNKSKTTCISPQLSPHWLDEVELKPTVAVQPVQVISAAGLTSHDLSKAITAEEIYFKIRSSMNKLFEARYDSAEYDQLIKELCVPCATRQAFSVF